MHLKAKQDFSWAHRGVQVEEFTKGQSIDTEDKDLIEVATREGWVEEGKAPTKAEQKAAIKARIKELEAKLADCEQSEEAAIEAELAAAQDEFKALG